MTIATYILGYITLCITVAVVIVFANFITAIIAIGFAIAAVVVALFWQEGVVRHG